MITIGIDPGWSSFGIAITKDNALISKQEYVPKDFGDISGFISELRKHILLILDSHSEVWDTNNKIYIERFVTYGGVQTNPEEILMLIGALYYFFSVEYSRPTLVKAIDWKIKICQYLVKSRKFSNPYKKLDKKYSLLVANTLSGVTLQSNHEADAICLSYLTDEILKVNKVSI